MGHYDWIHTWAAQYSPLDTKLMVGGVVDEMSGEIAIFSTGVYCMYSYISGPLFLIIPKYNKTINIYLCFFRS